MLLDQFMPAYNFREYHQALVAAPAPRVFQAIQELRLGGSPLVAALMRLRQLPWKLTAGDPPGAGQGTSLEQMLTLGFIMLASEPPSEMVLGLVGRFWTLKPRPLPPEQFRDFAQPGLAKVAANFLVRPLGPGLCQLSTETRVQCLGPQALRSFRAYWLLIRPFSVLTRREWLRLVRRHAETASA